MAVQPTFNLEPEEPQKSGEKIGRVIAITCPKVVQIGPVVRVIAILPYARLTRTDFSFGPFKK